MARSVRSARWRDVARQGFTGVLILALGLGPAAALRGAAVVAGEAPEETSAGVHEPLVLRLGRLWRPAAGEGGEIAEVTAYCASCHDESADATGAAAASHPGESAARNHPVDVAYPEEDPGYRAPEALEPALLLLGGRLSCVTCHAWDDPRHALVLTTEQSRLCRACHLI